MTYTKEQGKQKIKELVERFRYNLDVYKKSTYNETQVRREFIDPFFEALGWDVSNKQGYAEQYKDVVHEDAIKVGHSTRAPDYSFRIGGQRKFFVEAKKPAVNIKEDVHPSYQLRRYAWSAKLPLSIVTDFEEFSVFNCQMKPNPTDKPGLGRFAYYTFDVYLDKFDEIYDVFSKEAVLKGSFDRYAQSTKGKKGTATVDSEFLKEIESWRELLAKNIALRNPNVSIYELNYAVQKLLDRIIFLRICEDRGIEHYGQLQTKAESGDVYMHLLNHFRLAESKYNSGIFDFDSDGITPALTIDDKVLKTIIQDLYYPKSPYEFSVLGVEILGNVYEQFLGKVIRLTAGHQAKVETKPEVKKAGGVYYTPQYIVEYIVKNTVGKLVEGKTPEEIAVIKILDPACGSGSFLIGAYTYLLRYHLDWYTNNKPKKHKEAVFQVKENEWYLTTAEKKRILLDNVFGVDIDSQAVEVTKLSLLLKVLEHESRESIDQQMKLGLAGVLPNLEGNIKCGNSLIGPEYYDLGAQGSLFNAEEMRRVNVFDWDDDVKGFGEIMKKGGFDCVVGNPPYFSISTLGGDYFRYLEKEYTEIHTGYNDIMYYFIYRGIENLNETGIYGVIASNYYLGNSYAVPLRKYLKKYITTILNFKNFRVFKNANVHTNIIIASKNPRSDEIGVYQDMIGNTVDFEKLESNFNHFILNREELSDDWIIADDTNLKVIDKIENDCIPLGELSIIKKGATSGNRKIFTISSKYASENGFESGLLKKSINSKDIDRYFLKNSGKYLIYIDSTVDIDKYPNIHRYLLSHKKELSQRNEVNKGIYAWYRLERPREKFVFNAKQKLVVPYRAEKNRFAFDNQQSFNDGGGSYAIILKDNIILNLKYVLGILNSDLMNWYYDFIGKPKGKMREYFNIPMSKIPIHKIDFSNPTHVAQHDKLVVLVESMLELQKKYHDAKMEGDKELYERQIKIVDAQIDRLVFDLYGLTEEEVKVVVEGR